MLVWEETVRNFESRSRSLQLVGLSALQKFKVRAAFGTVVGMNGIVAFIQHLSKNHCACGRPCQAVVGDPVVKSITRARIQGCSKTRLENSSWVWNAGLGGDSEKLRKPE